MPEYAEIFSAVLTLFVYDTSGPSPLSFAGNYIGVDMVRRVHSMPTDDIWH